MSGITHFLDYCRSLDQKGWREALFPYLPAHVIVMLGVIEEKIDNVKALFKSK